jgi:HlyD family secretion protein
LSVIPEPKPDSSPDPSQPTPESSGLAEVIEQEQSKHRRRGFIWAGLAALVTIGITITWFQLRPKPLSVQQTYRTEAVVERELVREVTATGRIEAERTVEVGAELSGRIEDVLVDYNDRVHAGDVLARFDTANVAAQAEQARASVKAARTALQRAKLERDDAKRQLARSRTLSEKGIEPAEQLETAESRADVASVSVDNARAQLELQQANLAVAETMLERAEVRAPIDGQVLAVNIEAGQTVASSFQTPVLFLIAADLENMRVLAQVDEADVGEVVPGQSATFTVDAYPGETFTATVTELRSAATIVQNVVTYEAVLEVQNSDLKLKPGMTASVRIRTKSVERALQVPNAALRFTPPGETSREGEAVWIVDDEGVRSVPVDTGITDGRHTVVTSPSLTPGVEVAVDLTVEARAAQQDHDE